MSFEQALISSPVQHQIGFIGARNNHSLLAAETRMPAQFEKKRFEYAR